MGMAREGVKRESAKRVTQAKVDKTIHHLNALRECGDYIEMVGVTGVAKLREARDMLLELKRVEGWNEG